VKAAVMGELLLVVGLLCVAYLLYVQQEQLASLTLELDRVRGAVTDVASPVPPADGEVQV